MQKIFVFKLLRKGISQSICQYLLLINTSTLQGLFLPRVIFALLHQQFHPLWNSPRDSFLFKKRSYVALQIAKSQICPLTRTKVVKIKQGAKTYLHTIFYRTQGQHSTVKGSVAVSLSVVLGKQKLNNGLSFFMALFRHVVLRIQT